jgi:hypothetical protein
MGLLPKDKKLMLWCIVGWLVTNILAVITGIILSIPFYVIGDITGAQSILMITVVITIIVSVFWFIVIVSRMVQAGAGKSGRLF